MNRHIKNGGFCSQNHSSRGADKVDKQINHRQTGKIIDKSREFSVDMANFFRDQLYL